MTKRFAIIIAVLLGIYLIINVFQKDDDTSSSSDTMNSSMSTDDMMNDMQDDMSDDMMDDTETMADVQMSREQETRKLLAELKTIPVSEFAANKMKYEHLLEMHPGDAMFMRKVDFYSEKLADQHSGY
jgi:hypothetical protein